ncbi:methyltransferase domain-containing protein [Undibacterium sp. CY18W]|uniref:Malonyl-[acyl-carrier protein] O-methyltransferase n=1 Tax=Undibacterium hunanense TaxID=2762292 RepID=A0ABR6ZRM0_9BURK|nr:methyltransferase domain-containing protein [Undibacterium hunanense]MBC3918521.1 methyltransferase domain-containing protein [Undibacterium hunanense]
MLSAPIDLQLVRRLFARPEKIRPSAFLRREIANRMREKLELVKIQPQHLLDAGCGETDDVAELQKNYPGALAFGVDASFAMLQAGLQKQQAAMSAVGRLLAKWTPGVLRQDAAQQLLCADFARLPLANGSMDLIWSNLALHWHPQPDLVFAEWRRVLRTEGLLMFSCFGPDTLIELRQAFAGVDELPHTIPFVDMHDFGDMLVNAGFSTPVMDMEKITLTYTDVNKLLQDVRAIGGNPLMTRRQGLFGRTAYRKLLAGLEKQRNAQGQLELSFEIVYGHAFRPVSRKTAAGEAIIRFDQHKKGL